MTSYKFFDASPFRLTAIALLFSGLCTTQAFAFGGTVKNAAGVGLHGAKVFLMSNRSLAATTDSTGAFSINTSTGIFLSGDRNAAAQPIDRLSVRNGTLRFNLISPIESGSISIYSLDGRKSFETRIETGNAGAYQFALPGLSSGLQFLRMTLDGQSITTSLMLSGSGETTTGFVVNAAPSTPQKTLAKKSESIPVSDMLVVSRIGYLTDSLPVATYAQNDFPAVLIADTVSPLAPVTDYSVNGPYATVVEANVGPGNAYTIIRPETLGANGFKHAPIIYGHGINSQVSTFTTFLRSVASHGFVIIARNVLTGGPNNAGNTSAMLDGLNWILAQDTTTGSIYKGKLATTRASSMGYSVGGTAAVDIGAHPSLQTVVSIHGHISTATLNGTLLQTSGTLDNVGLPMQQQTYTNSKVQAFLGTVTGANHGYIQNNNGGVQRAAIIAWLRFWIYNDQGGKHYFYGPTCVMCTAPWENPQRKYWN